MSKANQYLTTLVLIALFTLIGASLKNWMDYHSIGYLYLISVIIVSATFTKGPIFLSALLSSLAWNYFFMPPRFSLVIGTNQDILMCYTYFFVASLGGYLNSRIRKHEKLIGMKEESERLYQTLINSISHEIRTPLTAISGNAASLLREEILNEKSRVRTTANELLIASDRLNRVVENLLDMSRIESGHLSLNSEVFSVYELIEHTLVRLKPDLTNHSIKVTRSPTSTEDDFIKGDFKLLDHVFGNLILNSIHYSPVGSEIVIEIHIRKERVVVLISDQGSGIKKDFRSRVFEKFFRIPGTPTGGVGLGLSIVKGILDAHQASISLLEVPIGTSFELIFKKTNLPDDIRMNIT